jgi:hypothetical protein
MMTMHILSLCGIVFAFTAMREIDALNLKTSTRRQVFAVCVGGVAPLLSNDRTSNASCIPGDDSVDCIGQFKERISAGGDDSITMSYGAFRPDRPPIVLMKPTSIDEAIGVLQDQRLAMAGMEQLVTGNKLEDAGVQLLRLLPKITVAGRYVVAAIRAPGIQSMLEQAETQSLAMDEMIAQGLKGVLGVSAVAQLQILSQLSQAEQALDDLIQVAKSGAAILTK